CLIRRRKQTRSAAVPAASSRGVSPNRACFNCREICAATFAIVLLGWNRCEAQPDKEAPISPASVLRTTTNSAGGIQARKGFRIQLVASEPMVVGPMAMAFDENGRLFVVEAPG